MNHLKRPFEISRLDHVVLRTGQLPEMLAFYEHLGASVERDVIEKMGMVQMRLGDSMMDILDINGPIAKMSDQGSGPAVDGRNMDHFAIRIDPYDQSEILEFCSQKGIEAQPLPMLLLGADGYGPAVYIKDPDGNRVELKGPPNDDQTPPEIPGMSS